MINLSIIQTKCHYTTALQMEALLHPPKASSRITEKTFRILNFSINTVLDLQLLQLQVTETQKKKFQVKSLKIVTIFRGMSG
jgi:hypothetical protein